jgi:rare lipoprotein A
MIFLLARGFARLALAGVVAGCQHAPVPLVDAQAPAYAVPGAPTTRNRPAPNPPPTPSLSANIEQPTAPAPQAAPATASRETAALAETGSASTNVAAPGVPAPTSANATATPTVPGPVEWSPVLGTPEIGIASWYGPGFHGRRTANGEKFDMHDFSAAHRVLPLGSYARVRNPVNGRLVLVRINDRGPFIKGRIIDLSHAAAVHLGVTQRPQKVEVYALPPEAMRSTAASATARAAPVRKSTRRQVRTL